LLRAENRCRAFETRFASRPQRSMLDVAALLAIPVRCSRERLGLRRLPLKRISAANWPRPH